MENEKVLMEDEPVMTQESMTEQESWMTDEPEVSFVEVSKENYKKGKKAYAGIGWRMLVYGLVGVGIQLVYGIVLPMIFGQEVTETSWFAWLSIGIPMYAIAFPIFVLLSLKMEKTKIEKHSMGFWKVICAIMMSAAIVGVGTVIGMVVNLCILLPFGMTSSGNALGEMMLNSKPFFRILVVGFGAPIVEELIFRKFLIDRVVKYGELPAILLSGVLFGLFHGNFTQAFFAAGLGLFFAYIYIRTGKIWYTILLHMVINLSTSVIAVTLLGMVDLEAVDRLQKMTDLTSPEAQELTMQLAPGLAALGGWFCIVGACIITGLIMWICFKKKFFMKKQECEIAKGKRFKASFLSWGICGFIVYCVLLFVYNYVSIILMA